MNPGDIKFGDAFTLHTRPFVDVVFTDWHFDDTGVVRPGRHEENPWGPLAIAQYNSRRSRLARRHRRLRRILRWHGSHFDRHIRISDCRWVGQLQVGPEVRGILMIHCWGDVRKAASTPRPAS